MIWNDMAEEEVIYIPSGENGRLSHLGWLSSVSPTLPIYLLIASMWHYNFFFWYQLNFQLSGRCVCDGLYMLGQGNGTIRRCGPVHPSCLEVSIQLAVFRWRCRTLSSACTLPAWMLPCSSALMIMDRPSEPVSQPQWNVVLYKSGLGHGVCS